MKRIMLLLVGLLIILTACNQPEISTNCTERYNQDVVFYEDGAVGEGTYKVGDEIKAGEYLFVNERNKTWNPRASWVDASFMRSYITGNCDSNDLIFDEIISDPRYTYIEVKDGEFLEILGGVAYLEKSAIEIDPLATQKSGLFKVGIDLNPGKYTVYMDDTTKSGTYIIYNENRIQIIKEEINSSKIIYLEDGQYINKSNISLSPMN